MDVKLNSTFLHGIFIFCRFQYIELSMLCNNCAKHFFLTWPLGSFFSAFFADLDSKVLDPSFKTFDPLGLATVNVARPPPSLAHALQHMGCSVCASR